ITVNGAGAAAIAVTKLIMAYGAQHIIMCDSNGIIYEGRNKGMNSYKEEMSRITNKKGRRGDLKEAIKEADVFIGLSKANMVTKQMVKTMAPDPIIFALANPVPE